MRAMMRWPSMIRDSEGEAFPAALIALGVVDRLEHYDLCA